MAESNSLDEQIWLSPTDAGRLIGVHRATIYRWIKEKRIPIKWLQVIPTGAIRIHRDGILRDKPSRKPRRK